MSTKMKLALALLVMVIVPGARAQTQTNVNAFAYGYFTAPDGRLALVNIVRTRDAAGVSTQLFYTFCGQVAVGVACQRGDGIIPNSAMQGTVLYDRTKPDVVRLTVDTSAVNGYHNELCTQGIDYDAQCLGAVAATGGLVTVTWTRTPASAQLYTSNASQYVQGRLTSAVTSKQGIFSARQTGTVLGVAAVAGDAVMATSTNSQALQAQFKARKVAAIRAGGVK